jgi:hypothetical protein
MFVNINGYGLVKFKPQEINSHDSETQFRGKIRLPKGVLSVNGKKWVKHDYWYSCGQSFNSAKWESS